MSTDRELLEMAAKAANIEKYDFVSSSGDWVYREPNTPNWNPLKDDGDALRLAVKLRFSIQPISVTTVATLKCPLVVEIWRDGNLIKDCSSDSFDIYELTRFAIARAAAELGKVMS